ncbi:MAG: alpha/beta fold hydrolase [Caldilineales bacterium]|nr:alpha/beta fold hydrolase [Caldilineales bacterium]MDW8318779.1 alpha/beta fold hydrolase [Anaerolineae bacterium]
MTTSSRSTPRWARLAVLGVVLLLAAALAACGRNRAPDQATPEPTAVAVSVQLPQAPAQPSPTATPTPSPTATATVTPTPLPTATPTNTPTPTPTPIHPLSIEYLRRQEYPGSDLVIEQRLAPGANYDRYIASYLSEGLKQYGLLTVPRGEKPATGWPVIIFNHGYIPPAQYRTTERYVAYVDGFARSGYIVFRPDYRGHGRSEGVATGAYGSPAYVIDVLNAVASLQRFPDADPNRIGMWGHSMGGWITLRAMVVDPDIKAGVIWAGVVGSYEDLLSRWRRGNRPPPTPDPNSTRGRWRSALTSQYGMPEENPEFWRSLSANYFLADLSGPIQLHHAAGDASVPVEFSQILYEQGQQAGMPIELYVYAGDNHNLSANFSVAMSRSVAFFDRWLKQPVNLAQVEGPAVFTGSGVANLRSGPGTQFPVVGQMRPGESLPILGSNVDRTWWQVQTANGPAWVADSVVLAARVADVPVVEDAAGP